MGPNFDRRPLLQSHGSAITADAGLFAYRELADTFCLTNRLPIRLLARAPQE
jgi:hypothetical protein